MRDKMEFLCKCPGKRTGVCPIDGGKCDGEVADIDCYGISCKDLRYRRIKEEKE